MVQQQHFVHPQALVETESIGDGTRIWAFAHVQRDVVIGENCNIGDHAFAICLGLTNVLIPSGVTEIGASAFRSCTGLTNATIGNSVINIDDDAFNNCKALKFISIPNTVTNIGSNAFNSCTNPGS